MNNNTLLRQESIKKVFSAIREKGPLSKRQLQELTGFSWGSISSITAVLTAGGYLTPIGKQNNGVGRKPQSFDISVEDNFIIGIDFNFHGVTAVLCNLNGKTVWEVEKVFHVKEKNYTLDILYSVIEKARRFLPDKKITAIAIAMQGTVDTKTGVSARIDGIDGWENVPIAELLQSRYGLEVLVLHDPDCLLYAEKYFGAIGGNGTENAVLIRMDHDIGIGVMYRGTILMSGRGATCEIGTMVIPVKTGRSVLKKIVSTIAVEERAAKQSGVKRTFEEIAALAASGDPAAKALFSEIGTALGFAINNVSILLNPEKVVLYGTVARHAELFRAELNNALKTVMGDYPSVLISKLDGGAAAIGATLFAADLFVEKNHF